MLVLNGMNIYITSWNRLNFTLDTIEKIRQRTLLPVDIYVFDNGSDSFTQKALFGLQQAGTIKGLVLMQQNTGCWFDKLVFHVMTESSDPYYVVTDNDVLPPDLVSLGPCWLTQMINIMNAYPKLGMLALQLPPQSLQIPIAIDKDIVYCKAVGNTFKLVSRVAMQEIWLKLEQVKGKYGDDGIISALLRDAGWQVAFTRYLWCLHVGQCKNWGYEAEQVANDPRKAGYGEPFVYEYDLRTYAPITF